MEGVGAHTWRSAGNTTILFCSAMLFWYEPAICFAFRVTRMCFVFARCERSFSRSCIVWSTFVNTPTKSNSERITDTFRSICE